MVLVSQGSWQTKLYQVTLQSNEGAGTLKSPKDRSIYLMGWFSPLVCSFTVNMIDVYGRVEYRLEVKIREIRIMRRNSLSPKKSEKKSLLKMWANFNG